MSQAVVRPENIPKGTSWVYLLKAPDAMDQCRVFGIEPSQTLVENRVLLCDFLTTLKINGGSLDLPENHYPEAFFKEALQPAGSLATVAEPTPTTGLLSADFESPPLAITSSAGGSETNTSSVLANHRPVATPSTTLPHLQLSAEPPWQQLITATATAVGESIARALATVNQGASSRPNFDSSPRVLQDLVNRIPITSGSDPRKFVEFLVQVERIRQLNLADSHALLVSLLPRTTNQLRTAWIRAVADCIPVEDLVKSLLEFFLPHRLRHSMVSDLLYRTQRSNEPLAEFISDLQDCKSLLLPSLSPSELLEIALTGINQDTRSRLSGFPAPASVEDLLALAPRIEVISLMHSSTPSSVPNYPSQQNLQDNGRYHNDQRRRDYPQNRQFYRHQPNRFHPQAHNSQRGRGQAPLHTPQHAANQHNPNSAPQSNNSSGQSNPRGGQ